jgi:hypothetical protein
MAQVTTSSFILSLAPFHSQPFRTLTPPLQNQKICCPFVLSFCFPDLQVTCYQRALSFCPSLGISPSCVPFQSLLGTFLSTTATSLVVDAPIGLERQQLHVAIHFIVNVITMSNIDQGTCEISKLGEVKGLVVWTVSTLPLPTNSPSHRSFCLPLAIFAL